MTESSDRPTQFSLKHALAVLVVVSVWSAVVRQPKLRSCGDLLTVALLSYYGTSLTRIVGSWIRRFAERGLPSIVSGITAATVGTSISLIYGGLLVDAMRHGEHALTPTLMGFLGTMVMWAFWMGGVVIVASLAVLTLADLFRSPLSSFPLVFAFNLFHAVIGMSIFLVCELAVGALGAKPSATDPAYTSMGFLGGALGFVFGSCGLHVHLNYEEDSWVGEQLEPHYEARREKR